ncbi:uncharacterized protein olf186-M isoform X2 [Bemisia tabaci]|uniref:uncharacterized protein olf186-M isoform X2 n=1 Tax=Bemisia tabaci TaxID=7038 RepID=UPI003B27C972
METGKNNFENFVKKINPDRLKNQLRSFRQYFSSPSSSSNESFKVKLNNLTESLVSLSQRSQFNLNIAGNKSNISSEEKDPITDRNAEPSNLGGFSVEKPQDFRNSSTTEGREDGSLGSHSQPARSFSTKKTTLDEIECEEIAESFVTGIINESRESAQRLFSQRANDCVEEILVKSLHKINRLGKHEREDAELKLKFEICAGDSVELVAQKLIEEIIFRSCKYVNECIVHECERAAKILVQEIIHKSEEHVNQRRKKKRLAEINDAWNSECSNYPSSRSVKGNNVRSAVKMEERTSATCIPSVFVETDSDCAQENTVKSKAGTNLELTLPLCSLTPDTSPRNKSPVTVQEWVDALPLLPSETARVEDEVNEGRQSSSPELLVSADNLNLGAEAQSLCGVFTNRIVNESADIDDAGSHCSSGVDSLLEARKVDPEEVLLSLGFGRAPQYADPGRIPQRFLQPSKLKGVVIDDFLRHQQDLVHTFESGFCGYRGLTGPSHAAPSVIVAKIMERLREKEREREADFSIRRASRHSRPSSTSSDKSASMEKHQGRFNKAARNILTKVKCTPGSVLTPDNRRWLDSQGDKSPDVPRRIIIGQRSFTFSRDGDLIESPPSSLTDSDSRWTSSTEAHKPTIDADHSRFLFPSIAEDQKSHEGTTPEGNSPGSKQFLSEELDSGIVEGLNSPLNNITVQTSLDSCMDNCSCEEKDSLAADQSTLNAVVNNFSDSNANILVSSPNSEIISASSPRNINQLVLSGDEQNLTNCLLNPQADVLNNNPRVIIYEPNPFEEAFQSQSPVIDFSCDQKTDKVIDLKSRSMLDPPISSPSGPRSLQEELESEDQSYFSHTNLRKTPPQTPGSISPSPERELEELLSVVQPYNDRNPSKHDSFSESSVLYDNIINFPRRLSSFCESLDHVIDSLEKIMHPLEQTCDSATESDAASTSGNFWKNKSIEHQYEELCTLGFQLQEIGIDLEIMSKEEFKALDSSQRCALQCTVVRQALNAYLMQLNSDETNAELKSCIRPEVQKVSDLLDTNEDAQKLAAVVKQMTLLLQHQSQLSEQLRDLTASGKPLCVELCDKIFRRVRGLELLVQNNARELAEMRQRLQATSSSSSKNS